VRPGAPPAARDLGFVGARPDHRRAPWAARRRRSHLSAPHRTGSMAGPASSGVRCSNRIGLVSSYYRHVPNMTPSENLSARRPHAFLCWYMTWN